jgi:hypothetical protein
MLSRYFPSNKIASAAQRRPHKLMRRRKDLIEKCPVPVAVAHESMEPSTPIASV